VKQRLTGICARGAAAAAVLFVLAAAHAGPAQRAHAVVNCTIDTSMDAEERAFLALINNHRAQNGRAPLGLSYRLSRAASWKSNDLGVNAYFAHDDLNRTWVQRIRDCGYGYNAWLGENIAGGAGSAQGAFDMWKNSSGHNANMLNANYTTIGIGRAYVAGSPFGWYWTTEFASIDDGWSLATTTPSGDTTGGDTGGPRLTIRERADGTLQLRTIVPRDSGVARVDFYVGGALIESDRRAPFTATWRGATTPLRMQAVAYDRSGGRLWARAITAASTR
jgi:uncharacterized protein YkwD